MVNGALLVITRTTAWQKTFFVDEPASVFYLNERRKCPSSFRSTEWALRIRRASSIAIKSSIDQKSSRSEVLVACFKAFPGIVEEPVSALNSRKPFCHSTRWALRIRRAGSTAILNLIGQVSSRPEVWVASLNVFSGCSVVLSHCCSRPP